LLKSLVFEVFYHLVSGFLQGIRRAITKLESVIVHVTNGFDKLVICKYLKLTVSVLGIHVDAGKYLHQGPFSNLNKKLVLRLMFCQCTGSKRTTLLRVIDGK